ncbi:cell surface protein SprA [Emticicia sp. C21]|uniref:T9SS outer membrane translocon Sov/SprA n=1 Tax=Emticicia sp. C21 TaxID=2302915 RepID=UPI000E355F26|nr:cell surface protein SprA [Emticicia sp. C21]RFS14077.1 cell surface protein SprA [Emticicia sp. C21]
MFGQLFVKNYTFFFILIFSFGLISESADAQLLGRKRNSTTKADTTRTDSLAVPEKDTIIVRTGRQPAYRWQDRYLNRYAQAVPQSPFYLKDPGTINNDFSVSPNSNDISITEKAGKGIDYKIPQSLTFNEYSSIQNAYVRKSILREYEELADGKSATTDRGLRPLLQKNPIVDRIFGGNMIDKLKPNGFVTLDFKLIHQFIDNPLLPIIQRRQTLFNFDEQININFNGQIGEKLGMLTNLDTKAAFNFENQLKLNFKNQPEDILQKVEAGNITMPVKSQLIPGVQNLFGVKAGFKFGKLDITQVVAQQRSKTESIVLNGGTQSRTFEIRADNYEENRHFFLAQFFRSNYERALRNLPLVLSGVKITRLEVYVTNRTNTVESMRNLIAFTDLGDVKTGTTYAPVRNEATTLYSNLSNNPGFRRIDSTTSSAALKGLNLNKGIDYEILRGAKRLTEREYKFNPELGYLSLVTPLRNDEILAVAFEYTYNGQNYKVGELTEDYSIRPENEAIMLKLLKSSTIRNRTGSPMWDLMMKNIYSLGVPGVGKQGFQLRLIYKDDRTGIDNPNLQEGKTLKDVPLVRVMNLDNLNPNNDPQPGGDGNFDFIEDITIDSKMGKLIFPVLEPFGSHLASKFAIDEQILKDKYVFNELYRTTLADAQQVTTKNKFFIRGSLQASSNSDIMLPLGASGQSVRIFAGGVQLQEGADYTIEPQLGRIKILNQSVLNSSRQIRIEWERPDLFNTQIRMMLGTRLDYNLSKDIHIGATAMTLRESTPAFMTRIAIGQEPVNNTIVGLDINYRKDARFLTRLLDALPLIQTKEMSSIQFTAEYAKLFPSVNNKRINGNAMIDDFEATRNINDLTRQPTRWRPGSAPEAYRGSDTGFDYNYKRGKISVYTIDQTTYLDGGFGGGAGNVLPPEVQEAANGNLYERAFTPQQIFPGRSIPTFSEGVPVSVLDVSYFPAERGMYNYNPSLTADGYLQNPRQNFGSIMRGITADNDFDNANTEYITFWMLDPFKDVIRDGSPNGNKSNTTGGKLKFHLGDISEDFIPDGRNSFENGLPANESVSDQSKPDQTPWGFVPKVQFMTDAFDNQPGSREKQDVGLDGLSNAQERTFGNISTYLNNLNINPAAKAKIEEDPSADDFKFFTDPTFTPQQSLIERFKNYLGVENNSPQSNANSTTSPTLANSVTPDKEDINADNTINDVENFYEYEIDLSPSRMSAGTGFIVDQVTVPNTQATWYLFRIPVKQFTRKFGDINGFKSIRFMRMMLTDFQQPVVLRFASLQLESNQYRIYDKSLTQTGLTEVPEPYDAKFKMGVVSIEENGCADDGQNCNIKEGKTPYKVPPGFIRDQDITQQQFNVKFNEQSMSLAVTNLRDGDSRGVFRNTRIDMLNYKRLRLFIHAENEANDEKTIGGAFIRIGTDLSQHYYEIEIPQLKITPNGSIDENVIWPKENFIDVALQDLVALKGERNRKAQNITVPYSSTTTGTIEDGTEGNNYKITVLGNPDLSAVMTVMIGLRNPKSADEQPATYTVWLDELRAYGFDQTSGDAGLLAANIKLADLATVSINANLKTFGFGGVQDKISERARETGKGIGIASNVEVDKFFPENWGLKIPFFVNFDQQTVTPHFNPLDPDMPLENALANIDDPIKREAYRRMVVDNNTRKGFNFSNVRKIKTKEGALPHFYDVENFSFTYAQNNVNRRNILIDDYSLNQYKGGFTYQYQPKPINWEPFKNNKSLERPFLYWLKDFNLSPLPTVMAFRTDFDKSFARTLLRNSDLTTDGVQPYFEKYFLMNRFYDLQWNLTKSILFNYTATMNAIVDEPYGDINTEQKAQQLRQSILGFGRAKNFYQEMRFTYRLPLDKFFLLDWVTADAKYNNNFGYQAIALNIMDEDSIPFGNTIRNGRDRGIRGKIDFIKLYNKVKYLKFANSPNPERKRFTRNPGDDENIEIPPSNVAKAFTRLLMAVRGIDYDYSIVETTILPGFMPSPKFFGLSPDGAPGLGFVLGNQYTTEGDFKRANGNFQEFAASKGWLSKTKTQTQPFVQTKQKKFSYRTTIEPFKDFRMQISGNFSRGDSYQEYYIVDSLGRYSSTSPVRNGNFSTSFWSFNTFFARMTEKDIKNNYHYEIFENMRSYRQFFAEKLTALNPNKEGIYDKNSQDVLVPAFIAAYSGKGTKLDLNKFPFSKGFRFPMPNWRIDYSGLANLAPFNKMFSSISISHSYSSTYSVGNFTSSLDYGAAVVNFMIMDYPYSNASKTTTVDVLINDQYVKQKQFVPVFVMSTVTLEEKFQPFIGVQFTTKSKITGRFDWNRERRAALNLSNSQVAEYSSSDFVFNFGFKKNGVKLPLRGRDGKVITLKNDLNLQFAFTIRDVKAIQRRLDGDPQPTQGNYNLQWGPRITYQVNKRVLLNFYVEHMNNRPFVTNFSYPRKTTTGGINVRFSLSDQ